MYQYTTEPWAHQRRMTEFLLNHNVALLHCDMGTGKSKAVLDAIYTRDAYPALVLAPHSVCAVWREQVATHTPAMSIDVLDTGRVVDRIERVAESDLTVCSYETIYRKELKATLIKRPWATLVLDESHRIKAPGGKASWVAKAIKAPRRWALTGTPLPQGPLDAYGQCRALDPRLFGTNFAWFRARYAVVDTRAGFPKIICYQNLAEFSERLDTIKMRVTNDVLDLPPITVQDVPVTLNAAEKKAYRSMKNDFLVEVEAGSVTAANALVKTTKLRQIVGGTLLDEDGRYHEIGTSKVKALIELIEDSEGRWLVFTEYSAHVNALALALHAAKISYCLYTGKVKELDRWAAGARVCIAQTKAASLGLNAFATARYCAWFGLTWSLADYEQAIARVHRPGQTQPVTVYRLLAAGTVDDAVAKALSTKADVVSVVLDGIREEA